MKNNSSFMQKHVLQICLFSFMFGAAVQWPAIQNMILRRLCLRDHGETLCSDIKKHPEILNDVQASASQYMTLQSISTDIIGAVMSLVLGAASDHIGRKPVILLPCFGLLLFSFVLLIQVLSVELWWGYFVVSGLCLGGSGGMMSFLSGVTNYVTDTTPQESRTERLSSIMPFLGLGVVAGMVASGMVSELSAILLCVMCSLLSMSMTYIYVDNHVTGKETSESKSTGSLSREIIQKVKSGIRTLLSGNDLTKRQRLTVNIVAGMTSMGTVLVENNLIMLYTNRIPFEWEPTSYGIFVAFKQISAVVGQVMIPPLFYKIVQSRSLRCDYSLLQISHVGYLASSICVGYATSSSLIYFSVVLTLLTGPGQAARESIMSRLVDPAEKGTFTSFSAFMTSLAVPLFSVVFNGLYSWAVRQGFPALTFYTMAGIHVILIMMFRLVKPDTDEEVDEKKRE